MRCSTHCAQRRHYGTTGAADLHRPARLVRRARDRFSEDPQLGPAQEFTVHAGDDGRHHAARARADAARRRGDWHRADRAGRCAARNARRCRRSVNYGAADLGRRVRVLWQGAEYRGRGRETLWDGKLTVAGNRIARFAPVNFLNPERMVRETAAGTALAWNSVTTGNLAGIDLWLDDAHAGHAQHRDQHCVGHGGACDARGPDRSRSTAAGLGGS